MAATAERAWEEKFTEDRQGSKFVVPYRVFDASDKATAKATLVAKATADAPASFVVTDVDAERIGGTDDWTGSATFASVGSQLDQEKQPYKTGETALRWRIGGGSIHITQFLKLTNSYPCNGFTAAPDLGGAIGVSTDGEILGMDLPPNMATFSVTQHLSPGDAQTLWATVRDFHLSTNSASVTMVVEGVTQAFGAEELVLLGATGGGRGSGDFEVTIEFGYEKSSADVCVDWPASSKPSSAVPKKGTEYAWVLYREKVRNKVKVKVPAAVYVGQVYKKASFSSLGIPSS